MADIKIAVINACKVLSNAEIRKAIPALQKQITRDFAPVWGVPADLVFVPKGRRRPRNHWWLVILDDSDDASAVGYHDITDQGLPLGKVFAATDQAAGSEWTATASHELLEMLADPAISLTVLDQTPFDLRRNVVGRLYSYEVCDPCQDDADGYWIDGVFVSDFVYPAWFEPFRSRRTRFDHRRLIHRPFGLRPGGYMGVYDMTSGTGWQQIDGPATARSRKHGARAPVGSRRERRRTPRSQWMKSAPV